MSHARCACKLNLTNYAYEPIRFCSVCGGLLPEKPTPKVRVGHAQLYERGGCGTPTTQKLRVSYHPTKGWSLSTAQGGFTPSLATQNTGEFLTTLIGYMPFHIQQTTARQFALALMHEAITNATTKDEPFHAGHHVGVPDIGACTMEDA